MAIIFVTDDLTRWGTGTGVPHPAGEADRNFWELLQRLTTLETTPPVAVSIDHITIVGDQMTIYYTDTDSEVFTLPVATLVPGGEWTPTTIYGKNVFLSNGGKLYITKQPHTSDATFDPNRVISGQPVYVKVLEQPIQPNDYHVFIPGTMGDNQLLMFSESVRRWQLPANLAGSKVRSQFSATGASSITLKKNGATIGTIDWAGTDTVPTFSFAGVITFELGDSFEMRGPATSDPTLADISLDILGLRL